MAPEQHYHCEQSLAELHHLFVRLHQASTASGWQCGLAVAWLCGGSHGVMYVCVWCRSTARSSPGPPRNLGLLATRRRWLWGPRGWWSVESSVSQLPLSHKPWHTAAQQWCSCSTALLTGHHHGLVTQPSILVSSLSLLHLYLRQVMPGASVSVNSGCWLIWCQSVV